MTLLHQILQTGTCLLTSGMQSTVGGNPVWNLDSQGDLNTADASRTFTTEFLIGNVDPPLGIGTVIPGSYSVSAGITHLDASSDSGVRVDLQVRVGTTGDEAGKWMCDINTWYTSVIYSIAFTWCIYGTIQIAPSNEP